MWAIYNYNGTLDKPLASLSCAILGSQHNWDLGSGADAGGLRGLKAHAPPQKKSPEEYSVPQFFGVGSI